MTDRDLKLIKGLGLLYQILEKIEQQGTERDINYVDLEDGKDFKKEERKRELAKLDPTDRKKAKLCKFCGRVYVCIRSNHIYCSNKSCYKARKSIKNKKARSKKKVLVL